MTARSLPTLPTFPANSELTSGQMTQLNTYMAFWANKPMFRMYQSVSQSIPNATITQVTLDVSQWDTDSGRALASPWNYSIPFAGRWRFTGLVVYAGNATGVRQPMIYQNGTETQGFSGIPTGGTTTMGTSTTVTLQCSVGDTIGLWTYQNSGGAAGTNVSGNQTSYLEGCLESLATP